MTIDTDIQAIAEYNANVSDMNTKINEFYSLIGGTLQQEGNHDKIIVRRGSSWLCEGEEIYVGLYQNFGSVSGSVDLLLDDGSSRSCSFLTLTGNVVVGGFGENFLVGVIYTIFIVQNSVGGHSFTWPTNTSVLGHLNTDSNAITVSSFVKLPDGKMFAKNNVHAMNSGVGNYE